MTCMFYFSVRLSSNLLHDCYSTCTSASLSLADLEIGLAVPALGHHTAVLWARGREHALVDASRDHLQPVGFHRS